MDKSKGIVKKSASISALVLVGKILGFVKQAVIAWAFGSNALTDIYFAADGYTSMFGQIMAQSVGPTVLTQYIHLDEQGKEEESKRLIRESYLFFSVISIVIIAINIAFSDQICSVIGISYTATQREELKFFLIVLCPVVLITSIIGVSAGYLDSHNRFLPGRLTSLFFSISIIVFVLAFRHALGLRSLLYGFILGYVLHALFMLILVVPKVGISLSNPFRNRDFIAMVKRFFPLVIGVSVVDLGHLIDKIVASSLESGSVSALYYGQVISSDIISAVIISSIGAVLLTSISKSVSSGTEKTVISAQIKTVMCSMTFIAGCLTVLYYVEGKDLIKLFFERGSFDSANTATVTSIATFYATGFIFMANREVLIKAHYAFHDTVAPMINSIVGVTVNLGGSIFLSKYMGISGIALATSFSLLVVYILSLFTLRKHISGFSIDKNSLVDYIKIAVCMIVSAIIGKVTSTVFNEFNFLVRMIIVGVLMVMVYMAVGIVLKEKTIRTVLKRFLKKERQTL